MEGGSPGACLTARHSLWKRRRRRTHRESGEGVSGHSLTSGEKLWFVNETNRFPIPVATQQDGIVLLSRGYRSGPYMAIRPGGKGNVAATHVVWKVPTGLRIFRRSCSTTG